MEAVVLGLYGGGKLDSTMPPPPPTDPKAPVGSYGGGPLEGEAVHPDLAAAMRGGARGTDSAVGEADMLPRPSSMAAYHDVVAARDRLRDGFRRAWRELELDVMLCPAFAFPAPQVEAVRLLTGAHRSTAIFNLLDCPAGVVRWEELTHNGCARGGGA